MRRTPLVCHVPADYTPTLPENVEFLPNTHTPPPHSIRAAVDSRGPMVQDWAASARGRSHAHGNQTRIFPWTMRRVRTGAGAAAEAVAGERFLRSGVRPAVAGIGSESQVVLRDLFHAQESSA